MRAAFWLSESASLDSVELAEIMQTICWEYKADTKASSRQDGQKLSRPLGAPACCNGSSFHVSPPGAIGVRAIAEPFSNSRPRHAHNESDRATG
jgi:hypothetical protein